MHASRFFILTSYFILAAVAAAQTPSASPRKTTELPLTSTLANSDQILVNHAVDGALKTQAITLSNLAAAIAVPIPDVSGLPGASYVYRNVSQIASDTLDGRLASQSPGTSQDLFSTRNNTTPLYVRNTTGILGNIDTTAISVWCSNADPRVTVTLITPDIGISANHYHPADGDTVRFATMANAPVNLVVSSQLRVGSTDVQVIKFTSAAPSTITPALVMGSTGIEGQVNDAGGFYVNQNFRAYTGDLFISGGFVALNEPSDDTRDAFYTAAISNDSSHPIFAVIDGRMVLLATLYDVTYGPSLATNLAGIRSAITSLGSSTELTLFESPVLGSAAYLDASTTSAAGKVVKALPNGLIDSSFIPPPDTSQFGAQNNNYVLAGPAGIAPGAVTFRALTPADIPALALRLFQQTFSNADVVGIDWVVSGQSMAVQLQVGTLTGPHVVTLPSAASDPNLADGAIKVVADYSGTCSATNTLTVMKGANAQRIDGANSIVLREPWASVTVMYRASTATWKIISRYPTAPAAAANADTSGATLGQLETEVNELKALLRTANLLSP